MVHGNSNQMHKEAKKHAKELKDLFIWDPQVVSEPGNYIPSKPDLMFIDEEVESESVDAVSTVSSSAVKTVESKFESVDVKNKGVYSTVKTKTVRKNSFGPPIIEDWNSDDESEVEFELKVEVKTVRPCIKKIKEDRLKLKELMQLSTKLSNRVLDLEKIKTAQSKEMADLKKRIKKLERKRRIKILLSAVEVTAAGMVSTAAKVNVASEYGYYCLKSMIEDKLQLGD
nr:hypothetical protein [Tanacetum cinerariifolium]